MILIKMLFQITNFLEVYNVVYGCEELSVHVSKNSPISLWLYAV